MSTLVKTKIDNLNWFYHLDWREIQWVEQDADYQNVVTTRGRVRIHGTMESLIKDFPHLLRVHRSFCVNPHQMMGYAVDTETTSVHLMFKDGAQINIGRGRNYWDEFTETFEIIKTRQNNDGNWI
jgi:DNA-binding LytR/AlgR family response regulator